MLDTLPSPGSNRWTSNAGVIYPFLQNWAVNAQVGYSRLLSDAADSPIVRDKGSFSGGLFLAYRF